ncbi:MAG: 4Fe-4S binding protein [Desulfohalobiaceae bacterium]
MTTFSITNCKGIEQGCPYLIQDIPDPGSTLERILEDSGWPELLQAATDGKPKPHQQVRTVLAGCPNACSRPQIADFGLIRAGAPTIEASACTDCGACAATCPEGAISSREGAHRIDRAKCLYCLRCRGVCPEGALEAEITGYRVLVGGRLGRRPMLARELQGVYSLREGLDLLAGCLAFLRRHFVPGVRLGDLVLERPEELRAELDAACPGADPEPPRPGRAASTQDRDSSRQM